MATLPTNYVDDVLDSTMGGKRRYNMTTDSYGTYLTDVTDYDQRGSTFGAAQINEITTQVNTNTNNIANGDSKDNTVTYTSGDASTPSSFQSINVLASGETHSSLFNKISKAVANVRWLNSNKRTTGAYDDKNDTVTFTTADVSSDSSATSWTTVSQLTSGSTFATLLNRISAMMKNTRYLYYYKSFKSVTSYGKSFSLNLSGNADGTDKSVVVNSSVTSGDANKFIIASYSVYETGAAGHSKYVIILGTRISINSDGLNFVMKLSNASSSDITLSGYCNIIGPLPI